MKRGIFLSVAGVLAACLSLTAEETREQKEKRLADAVAEMLELMNQDPVDMSDEDAKKRDKRAQELEDVMGPLVEELAGKDRLAGDKLMVDVLKKHHPDAAAKLEAIKAKDHETDCKNQLKQVATHLYKAAKQDHAWPASLDGLKRKGFVEDERLLVCPVHGGAYVYTKPPKGDDTPMDQIMLVCPKPHLSDTRAMSTFSGSVIGIRESIFLAAEKGGRIDTFKPRVKGVVVEFAKMEGKTYMRIHGTVENLGDPALTKLPAQATVQVRVFRTSDHKSWQTPVRKFVAKAGTRSVTFDLDLEVADSPQGLSGSANVEDTGSCLSEYVSLEIPGSGE